MNIYRSDKKSGGASNYPDLTNKPQINGVELVGNKTSAQLGIITNAVDDLVNYYLKSDTYTKLEVDTLIQNVASTRFVVVNQLPTTDIQTNVIYLVPSQTSQQENVKDEWINLDGTTSGWEQIGSTAVDLSGYVTTTALNATLTAYVTNTALQTALADYITSTSLATTLSDYITSSDLATELADYVTSSDLSTALGDYTTTSDLNDMLADKQDTIQLATIPTASVDYATGYPFQYIGSDTQDYKHGYWYECKLINGSYTWVNVKVQDGDTIQVTSMPTASADWVGKVLQFISTSTQDYKQGYFYRCVNNSGTYSWVNQPVQDGDTIQYSTMPSPASALENKVVQFTGTSNNFYTNGYFYKCINDNGTYKWINVPTQDSEQIQYETLPTAGIDYLGMVVQYIGATGNGLTHNYFYECVSDGASTPTYSWENKPVQDVGSGHTIKNSQGTAMTSRENLQFEDSLEVSDDLTNNATLVDIVSFTDADMNEIVNPIPPTVKASSLTANNVSNWMDCAGVVSPRYTSLSNLLVDADTMMLMTVFPNSADYLLKCTDWISDIVASENAMRAIGNSNYCSFLLIDNSTWRTAILASQYSELVLDARVPVMTSNTAPSGEASADYGSIGSPAYLAFDGNDGTGCAPQLGAANSGWLRYSFTKPANIAMVDLKGGSGHIVKDFKIQASNDNGANWIDIYSDTNPDGNRNTYYFGETNYYKDWRLYILNTYESNWAVDTLQFYGKYQY